MSPTPPQEPIRSNKLSTWPDRTFISPAGTERTYVSRLATGDIIAFNHRILRVIDVGKRDDQIWHIRLRPLVQDPTWSHNPHDIEIGARTDLTCLWRYPQDHHLPVCSDCGGPWPCQKLHIDRDIARDQQRERRYALPGICPACQEPVTTRQTRQTWPVNLYALDPAQPVTFHLRQQCIDEARRYDLAMRKAGHPSQLGYPNPPQP
ncbi:hypothetical protein [Luteococcus sp.]|uniref:hypothetical protein n=1 Tax=Luteococcus sp. TaxID=1969402 RepID=UPI003735E257